MECQLIGQYFDEELDGTLSEPQQHALYQHLKHCARCQRRYDADAVLRRALKDWRVPPPRPGFVDRVLHTAQERNRHWPTPTKLIGLAMAASLVVGIGMGLVLAPLGTEQQSGMPTIAMSVDQPQNVRLAFDSTRELRDVTLTVSLPADVEVVGYPGQRVLSWRTDLKAGKNQLTLPLIARKGAGGALAAALTHGRQHKEFSLYLAVQHRRDAADLARLLDT